MLDSGSLASDIKSPKLAGQWTARRLHRIIPGILILNINIFAPDKSQYTKGKEYLYFNLYLNKILTQSEIIGKMGV